MKNAKKDNGTIVRCVERDRLLKAFLKVGKEWGSMQDRMRKVLKQGGAFEPDLARVKDIRNRIEATHKLFGEHIAKHGCWQPNVSLLKATPKKRKHIK